MQVLRWCDGSYLEDQDQWWLSGIHRHVRLYSKPRRLSICDYYCTSSVAADGGSALVDLRDRLLLRLDLGGAAAAPIPQQLVLLVKLPLVHLGLLVQHLRYRRSMTRLRRLRLRRVAVLQLRQGLLLPLLRRRRFRHRRWYGCSCCCCCC